MSVLEGNRRMPAARGHWLLGSAREMRDAPHRFVADLGLRHGGIARFRILHRPMIAVTHPDLIREVLVTRHERYERSFHYRTTQEAVGRGLITTDGAHWKQRRRQVQPAFRPENLRRIVPAVHQAVAELLARWEAQRRDGQAVSLVEDMQVLTLTVMCRALLSVGISAEEARRLGAVVRESLFLVRRKNTSLCPMPHWAPLPGHRRLRARRDVLDAFVSDQLRRRLAPGAEPRADIAQALLDARDPETGAALPWQALVDETKSLFAAGFESTATALTWTLHRLAHDPAVAAAWHAECDSALAGRPPEWDDQGRLPLIGQIFQETMRLYPPVYTLGRVCLAEDTLGGCRIRAGETLLLSIYGAHRTPEFWPEPERFDPDRFAPGREVAKHAYLPFALGKHLCVGAGFATAEAVLALASIGQRYRLRPTGPLDVPVRAQVTLVPAGDITVRLEARR
jgi:enediyne biosynthesis protein E7